MKFLILLILASCSTTKNINNNEKSKEIFGTDSKLIWIKDAVNISNCILGQSGLIEEVRNKKEFTFTDKTPEEVAKSLESPTKVKVKTYSYWNPFSSVIATTYANDRTSLYFNLKNNPRNKYAHVNTVFHESLHLWGYSHGDNYPKGKEDSVNYKIGSMSEKYVDDCEKFLQSKNIKVNE